MVSREGTTGLGEEGLGASEESTQCWTGSREGSELSQEGWRGSKQLGMREVAVGLGSTGQGLCLGAILG